MKKAPIYNALTKYLYENNTRLHMPGHVGQEKYLAYELQKVASIDVTEVEGIDDLHLPVGAIKEAQELLALAYGAKNSFLLVNGATSGIHALFLGLVNEGKEVLIPRNAHRSYYGGLVLSGLMPKYMKCEVEPNLGIALTITLQEVIRGLQDNQNLAGVFLTSPSYYGTTLDIDKISNKVHEQDLVLFVDEAHGSHFPFHQGYPKPALWQGADAVVNGFHKSLPVLNQGACLHIGKYCEMEKKIRDSISLITTTSPSFPILASIDLARNFMQEKGEFFLEAALQLAIEFTDKINSIKGLKVVSEELKYIDGVVEKDPLKVLVAVNELNINGYEVSRILRQQYHISVELQEEALILAMFSIFHTREDWEKFYYALKDIAIKYHTGTKNNYHKVSIPPLPKVIISPRQAYVSDKKPIKLEESAGLISGEFIASYPPGIPCLLPGELITEEVIDYLLFLRANHIRIQGPQDAGLININVID